MHFLILMLAFALLTFGQISEPTVPRDAISVHQVHRGTMPLREIASGSITSTDPPKAIVVLQLKSREVVRTGQSASMQIEPPKVISGKVTRIDRGGINEPSTAEIEFAEPLPVGTIIGTKIGALIDVGELSDVIYFERPALAQPDTESIIFLIEPDGQHAKRIKVRYGHQSGGMMEIIRGLSEGDHVIVTDMSAWSGYARVQLK
jgi:hypothetical protein